MTRHTVNILGPGRTGSAIAAAVASSNELKLEGIYARTIERAESLVARLQAGSAHNSIGSLPRASVWIVAVRDEAIGAVAKELAMASLVTADDLIVHCSGCLDRNVLSALESSGASLCAMHPVRSFAYAEQSDSVFNSTLCAVEGDERGLPLVKELVTRLGGRSFEVNSSAKAGYHAGLVFASNYLVTSLHMASQLLEEAGIHPGCAQELTTGLARNVIENVTATGPEHALTGPIERGDVTTISEHLHFLDIYDRAAADLYRALGNATLDVAQSRNRKAEEMRKIRKLLTK